MKIKGTAVYPQRTISGNRQACLSPMPTNHQPRFGMRQEESDTPRGSMTKTSLSVLGILATGIFPYLAYKSFRLAQAESFNWLVRSDHANEQVSQRYPDTYCGEYNESLHSRLRVLAEGAARGDKRQVTLFKKALTLPRVQSLLSEELSAKAAGKPRLADIIQQQGRHNPNMVKHLSGLIQQSIRHGEGWDHFTAVKNNEKLREALAKKDAAIALEQLKTRSLNKADKRQSVLAERLLANPYNFGIIVRATGGNRHAQDFVRQLVTKEIEQDLRVGKNRDYISQQKMREKERHERTIRSLPLPVQQEMAARQHVSIAELADALSPEAQPGFDIAAQRQKEEEARHVWRWKDTSEQELQSTVRELTDMTMSRYEPHVRHQVNP